METCILEIAPLRVCWYGWVRYYRVLREGVIAMQVWVSRHINFQASRCFMKMETAPVELEAKPKERVSILVQVVWVPGLETCHRLEVRKGRRGGGGFPSPQRHRPRHAC